MDVTQLCCALVVFLSHIVIILLLLFRYIIFAHLVIIFGYLNFFSDRLRLRISKMFHIQQVHFNATYYDGLTYLYISNRQVNLIRARALNCSHTQPDLMLETSNQGFISQKFRVNNVEFMSEYCSVFEWTMLSLWVNNLEVMSEQYSVYECIMFSLWVNNIQSMSEQCSIHEYNVQFMIVQFISEQYSICGWTMLQVLVNYA